MRSLSDLNALALVKRDVNFPVKHWCKTASNLLIKGRTSQSENKIEDAYIYYLKAITIIVEIIPNLADSKEESIKISVLRKQAKDVIDNVETIRSIIKKSESSKLSESTHLEPIKSLDLNQPANHVKSSTNNQKDNFHLKPLEIKKETANSLSKSIPASSFLSSAELFSILQKKSRVLILDIRHVEEYILGHIT